MKKILLIIFTFIATLLIVYALCFVVDHFFLDLLRTNKSLKERNHLQGQDILELSQLIKAQTTEIRELKEDKQELSDALGVRPWACPEYQDCGGLQMEVLKLKGTNRDCLNGLNQCIMTLEGLMK